MKTLTDIRAALEAAQPELTELVNGEVAVLSPEQRAATLDAWAQAEFEAQLPPARQWPDVQAFVAEFTLEELAAIELSQAAQIAALRMKLKTWQSAVHADHPLVQAGRAALVSAGILTVARAAEIFD